MAAQSFDIQAFLNAKTTAREAEVSVPKLKSFFPKGKKAVWKVRGLTGPELGRVYEARNRTDSYQALIKALAGDGDKAEKLRESMGLSDEDIPADIRRRIEMLAQASVEPELGDENRDVAVKLCHEFPIEFYNLTNKIDDLTGQGVELGKPKRSGATKKSGSR